MNTPLGVRTKVEVFHKRKQNATSDTRNSKTSQISKIKRNLVWDLKKKSNHVNGLCGPGQVRYQGYFEILDALGLWFLSQWFKC